MAISANDLRFLIHQFPTLANARFYVRSPQTVDYNCIGWAATRTMDQWWEPASGRFHWPPAAPRKYTIPAYQMALASVGFSLPVNESVQPDIEKLALYALNGEPTHAARQLSNGWWTSKIGQYWDIEHETLQCHEGEEFGAVACILGRTGQAADPIGDPQDYAPSR